MTTEVFLYPRLDSRSVRNLDKYKAASPRVRVRLCKQSIIQVKREVLGTTSSSKYSLSVRS